VYPARYNYVPVAMGIWNIRVHIVIVFHADLYIPEAIKARPGINFGSGTA
jgi:hypothetical protein